LGFPITCAAPALGNLLCLACLAFTLFPAIVSAQSAMTGVVKDSSGGVLPGVTVEAASPALIEKVRTVVTDAQGRYAIVDLRPGLYKVTFTIAGFSTVVQERIELPSNFTATVSAELRVGALEVSFTARMPRDQPVRRLVCGQTRDRVVREQRPEHLPLLRSKPVRHPVQIRFQTGRELFAGVGHASGRRVCELRRAADRGELVGPCKPFSRRPYAVGHRQPGPARQ
jgi:hypothetical protein